MGEDRPQGGGHGLTERPGKGSGKGATLVGAKLKNIEPHSRVRLKQSSNQTRDFGRRRWVVRWGGNVFAKRGQGR